MPGVVLRRFGARFILCPNGCGRHVRSRTDDPTKATGHVRPGTRHLCLPKGGA